MTPRDRILFDRALQLVLFVAGPAAFVAFAAPCTWAVLLAPAAYYAALLLMLEAVRSYRRTRYQIRARKAP